MIEEFAKNGIEAGTTWKPMHMQPIYENNKYFLHDYDVSKDLYQRGICLPSATIMSENEQVKVIDIFIKYVKRTVKL